MSCEEIHSLLFPCINYCDFENPHKHWNVFGQVGHFCGTWCKRSGMIENCSFNLGEFYVKMGKTNRNLSKKLDDN